MVFFFVHLVMEKGQEMNWRIVLTAVLVLSSFKCAHTLEVSEEGLVGIVTPADSAFWCGDHCVVFSGCEPFHVCLCSDEYRGMENTKSMLEKTSYLWYDMQAILHIRITQDDIIGRDFDIRIVNSTFNDVHRICGVFPRQPAKSSPSGSI